MTPDIPYSFFRLFETDASSFICQGEVSEDLIGKTIRLGEYSIRRVSKFSRLRNKISFLINESLQNLIRYEEIPGIVHQTNNRPGAFMIRNSQGAYYIVSSNLVKNEKIEGLKNKLNSISQPGNETGALIHEKNHGTLPQPGSESGLIEMTRKSGNPLQYDFEYVNYYLSCFYLQVKLSLKNKDVEDITLQHSKGVFSKIHAKHVMLLYKGDFSQQSMLPVLGMIETNLKKGAERYKSRRRMFYFVVELLQNISKHAFERNGRRQGVLVICKNGKGYHIYSGNLIASSKVDELKAYLNGISSMDKNQLSLLYKEHLSDGKIREKGGAGLGLIDTVRYSKDKPVFDFRTHDNESTFYSFGFSI
jgi:Family of unknown function (DUF6272)